MPPSPGARIRTDTMKDSILKESTAGWSNAITPLRIAKRENMIPGSKGTASSVSPTPVVPRRSSNSYKHMFTNNLVSKSPFKSQIPTPAKSHLPRVPGGGSPRTARKTSGEKRPRPESLVQQAEIENQQRVKELGFKRRQSKAFIGMMEKEPVSKSPFRRIGPNNIDHDQASIPIPIELPDRLQSHFSEEDTTSLETSETDTLNDKNFGPTKILKPALSPSRPLTPSALANQATHISPSPNFERRSPTPSALQASPVRSSLVQKPRLLGPRARSMSGSPADTPTRERKTVTFDECCDVVEFDRASHEDRLFETDDEDIYGPPEGRQDKDSSIESSNASADSMTPTHSPNYPRDRPPHLDDFDVHDDSINGLVDSMLQEASALGEVSTPDSHQTSFMMNHDEDMVNGGFEDGIPHGRIHHAERAKMYQQKFTAEQPRIPGAFEDIGEDDEPSFSSISLSTPPKKVAATPGFVNGHTPAVALPPDIETENGVPYGRTHHAERIKIARESEIDREIIEGVQMLPASPSPMTRKQHNVHHSRELSNPLIPKFDLGVDLDMTNAGSKGSFTDDVFNASYKAEVLSELGDEHADLDDEILSNTSIASFHDIPPRPERNTSFEQLRRQSQHDTSDTYNSRLDKSLDESIVHIVNELQAERERTATSSSNDVEMGRADVQTNPVRYTVEGGATSPISPMRSPGRNDSQTSLSGSVSDRSRSPRISKEDVMKRLSGRRSKENINSSPVTSPKPVESAPASRQPLEERLKRALSPTITSPTLNTSIGVSVQDRPTRPDLHLRAHTYDFNGRPLTPVSANFDFNQPGVDIADMRSALDRLVDDVSATGVNISAKVNHSTATTSDGDISMAETELITEESGELLANLKESLRGKPSASQSFGNVAGPSLPSTFVPNSTAQPGTVSNGSPPPPPPPKDKGKSARQEREELIKERRRQARARDSGEYIPPRRDAAGNLLEGSPASRRRSGGRPSARRSLSTGDADDLMSSGIAAQRRVSILKNQLGGVLGMTLEEAEDPLIDSIERELKKMDGSKKKTYELREHEGVVYASSSAEESIQHMSQVGDLDSGKAWRAVRRPSDMNEYSRQIREFRSQEKPGKAHGKVFVKVLRIKGMTVPFPLQQTVFSVTLNNGIHFVTTPESRFTRDARIEQEFELIEHTKLEFTLTLKIRKDPHIAQQFKMLSSSPPPQPAPPPQRGGMRSFFGGGTPKRPKHVRANTEPIVPQEIPENLARYLKPDGTLARAFIAFKDIASRCDMKLFETSYPLIGQRLESPGEGGGAGGTMVPKQIGEIVLQIFRLPPLPGVPTSELPQSLEECHRGLRHVSWHKVTYHEGILTQLGGDCSTWRRRQLRVIGGSLIAFNDVTKRATATIDLKKAIAIEDDQEKTQSPKTRDVDDFDAMYGVERSFRLIFPHKQEITFFADTDEEKVRWLEVLRALVGHIPPNPLWAELAWQRQNEPAKAAGASTSEDGDRSRKQR